MPVPLLTLIARALIALLPRLLIYLFAMLAGAGVAGAGAKFADARAKRQKAAREAARKRKLVQ